MQFLEVQVRKTCECFEVFPKNKVSRLETPWLSVFSMHPSNVHRSWPASHLKHRLSLCSSAQLREHEGLRFLAEAKSQNLHPDALKQIIDIVESSRVSLPRSQHGIADNHTSWFVLPYFHAFIRTGIARKLQSWFCSTHVQHAMQSIGLHSDIRLSWRNSSRHACHLFAHRQQSASKSSEGAMGSVGGNVTV